MPMLPPFGNIPENLPFHLMLAMMQSQLYANSYGSSSNAFLPWNLPWMQALKPKSPMENWLDQLQKIAETHAHQAEQAAYRARREKKSPRAQHADSTAPDPALWSAIGEEALKRSANFMEGAQAFLSRSATPPEMRYPVLWQRGNARLLDIAPRARNQVAVVCIPSLINKSYILDLYPEVSLVRHLARNNMRPLILDWGAPGDDERGFSTAEYIVAYALDALDTLRREHDGPIVVLGYCMGGIMATAIAQLAPFLCDGLILLATPWDFSAPDTPVVLLNPATQLLLTQWFQQSETVAPWLTQGVFHLIDPFAIQRKYARFSEMDEAEKQHFVAVEHWANDGVPLTREVAQECFVQWPQQNILATHQWKVGRKWMEPSQITCPTLAFIPQNDKIVPQGCAIPLTAAIPKCTVIEPEAGHVSMLVGEQATAQCLTPMTQWLKQLF